MINFVSSLYYTSIDIIFSLNNLTELTINHGIFIRGLLFFTFDNSDANIFDFIVFFLDSKTQYTRTTFHITERIFIQSHILGERINMTMSSSHTGRSSFVLSSCIGNSLVSILLI